MPRRRGRCRAAARCAALLAALCAAALESGGAQYGPEFAGPAWKYDSGAIAATGSSGALRQAG